MDFETMAANPSHMLALAFSLPSQSLQGQGHHHLSLELRDDSVDISIPRTTAQRVATARLLGSKETIAFSILLFELWRERFRNQEGALEEMLHEAAHRAINDYRQDEKHLLMCWFDGPGRRDHCWSAIRHFFKNLDIHPKLVDEADKRTQMALRDMERSGLLIDPVVTGTTGLMVLLGLVPVHWSVRTIEGDRMYRELTINAPLWSFRKKRSETNEEKETEFEFNFRGVEAVKKLIRSLAMEYLKYENEARREMRQPTIDIPDQISIEGEPKM